MGRAFGFLDPEAVRIEGGGVRRMVASAGRFDAARPGGARGARPQLRQGGVHAVGEALLRRGVATFSYDGPGRASWSTARREPYPPPRGRRVIDALATRADLDTSAAWAWSG